MQESCQWAETEGKYKLGFCIQMIRISKLPRNPRVEQGPLDSRFSLIEREL